MKHADMNKVPPSPDAFAYSDHDVCREKLAEAGFIDVEVSPVPSVFCANSADGFWEEFLQFSVRTPIIMDQQTNEICNAIQTDVADAITQFESDGELAVPMPSFVVSGVKPA